MTPILPMLEIPAPDTGGDPWFFGWRYVDRQRDDGSFYTEMVPLTEWDVLHPQEDDFIVTNKIHVDICSYLASVFSSKLANRPGAIVHVDHRVDWQVEGIIPHGPDLSIFFDSDPVNPTWGTYRMRDLGGQPYCVVEVTSPSTRRNDFVPKLAEYAVVGIPIYVIIDVAIAGDAWEISLLAFHLTEDGRYEPMLEPGASRLWLPELEIWISTDGHDVVCLDAHENPIGDYTSVTQMADAEKKRADKEKKRADKEKKRADVEKQRADKEKEEKILERQRADEMQHKLQEMERELRRLRGEES